ncbi:MAG: hypothetical protein I3J02_07915 [Prevotella sp.]|nr:hypothetical protein [Prevotella sp.]
MNQNVIELLEDPVFLRYVLDNETRQGMPHYSSSIHPTRQEIDEAEHILLTLDEVGGIFSDEEIVALKNRIKSLIEAENGRKNN